MDNQNQTPVTEKPEQAKPELIPNEDLLALARKVKGATITRQKGFFRIAKNRKALYVGIAKRGTTRVDISGFTMDDPAVEPTAGGLGKVTGHLLPKKMRVPFLPAFKRALAILASDTEGDKLVAKSDVPAGDSSPEPAPAA